MSDYKTVYHKALYFLAKREFAVKELKLKLQKYTDNSETINCVISDLLKANYLSENRFIEAFVDSKKSQSGVNKIKYALANKVDAVDDKLRELDILFPFEEQLDTALNLLVRKYRFIDVNDVDYSKAIRFLYGRGFSFEVAKQAFRKFQSIDK